ncbi:MAG: hypothetical protein ACO3EE_04220 [Flavobacteriales bacterium]
MRKIIGSLLLSTFMYSAETKAQIDSTKVCESHCCCSKEVALPAGIMLGHVHAKGEWMFSYRYMNMAMQGIQQGISAMSANDVFVSYLTAPEEMHMNMHMLMGMYGINNRLTLMAMLNYNSNLMHMEMFGGGANHVHSGHSASANEDLMQSMGIGDIKLYGIYALINQQHHKLLLNGGISIPTGSITITGDADGMPAYDNKNLPYMMQMGSGTFDVLPGLTYMYHKTTSTFGIQSNANIHLGYNSVGYSLGNEITASTWYAYRWLPFISSSLRADFTATEAIYGSDASLYYFNEPAANTNNYGGTRSSVYLGTVWQPSSGTLQNWQLAAEFGVPVYQNLTGIQSPTKYFINANLNFTF